MGFDGKGYFWHKLFKFPDFPFVTKTLTLYENKGRPYAIMRLPFVKSVWNKVSLHNRGVWNWVIFHHNPNAIVSISGNDYEIEYMCEILDQIDIKGIELNYSCPNTIDKKNKIIPKSRHPLQLKLSCFQDPHSYDLTKITKITVNSVPKYFGGMSGKYAQKYNWPFIEKFNKEGLTMVGSSMIESRDVGRLIDIGCEEIAIGSIMLIDPWSVERL